MDSEVVGFVWDIFPLHTGLRCPTGHVFVFMVTSAYTSGALLKLSRNLLAGFRGPAWILSIDFCCVSDIFKVLEGLTPSEINFPESF